MSDGDVRGVQVAITVRRVLEGGDPPCRYAPGESRLVTDFRAPEGLCMWAFSAMMPALATLRFGGSFPWEEADLARVCCPDPANPVVFELQRTS